MIHIKIPIKSKRSDVIEFLKHVADIIDQADFDIEQNFLMIRSRKADVKHSTPYTLLDLDYDAEDVIQVIRGLTIKDYSETLIDNDDNHPPLLFVFGKDINNKEIYIKLKIRENVSKYILCVSFHYAEYRMIHPYT